MGEWILHYDGRIFRAEGKNPGPVAILEVKDDDIFGA